jgi:23S rRNA (cytosine1962-C5)-methyltransferase
MRHGHPWIYRSDVLEAPSAAGAAVVVDERDRIIGIALYSPASTIALRMLTHEEVVLDEAFWHQRISRALALRSALALDATAYRLVHAEADALPSLIVDRYGEHLVVQLLSAGLETFRLAIVGALVDLVRPAGILARNDAPVRQYEQLPRTTELLHGAVPALLEVRESEVRYLVEPWTGQKTGAFLDQRENRIRAGTLARGRALDAFAYHGSFALHLARNAEAVVAVDSSTEALARARRNLALNGRTARLEEGNVFDFLREEEAAGRTYDIVVLDPPAFAKRRDHLEQALRGYKEVNLRALRLLAPGGHLLTFSCSYHVGHADFRAMLGDAAADAGRPVRWIESRHAALDHPEIVQIPETSYLKGAVLQVSD